MAYAATKWVAAHGEELGVDGARLAVVGNSVGGNMATVVSQMTKDREGPAIRFQGLLWPVTDHAFDTASYDAFENGDFLSRAMMKWFWNAYIADATGAGERNPRYASPLRATLDELKGLPPAPIQTAQFDVLRDEGEAYGHRLDQAGNEGTTTQYQGTIHDFGLLNALAAAAPTRAAMQQMATALKTRLQ